MFKTAIPLVHVETSHEAVGFYCDKLGFGVRSIYRPVAGQADPAYCVLVRDGAVIHASSFPADGIPGGVVTIVVDDIQALHDELVAKGVDVGARIMSQDWGNREVYVRDPADNAVRFHSE